MPARAADAPAPQTTATAPAAESSAAAADKRAVMTGEQVVKILDETVDWYRTLGSQQQSATQPSDLLILYANRQTAEKVIKLAFDIARANAELLSSDAEIKQNAEANAEASPTVMVQRQRQLDARRKELQGEVALLQQNVETSSGAAKSEAQAKLAEVQSELDLVNARRNLAGTMSQFVYQSDANGSGANALKEHIDAIAASIPSSSGGTATVAATNASGAGAAALAPTLLNANADSGAQRLGIWDLTGNVLRLSNKLSTIHGVDERTASLQATFTEIRALPIERIRVLSARSDQLAKEADASRGAALKQVRDEFDTLAWLFAQTSAILIPLSQEGVLLNQYRRNLASWQDTTKNQYYDAIKALAWRLAILVAMLAVVFGAAELWRRAVFRYVHEPRRRYQFLLVRKIVLWALTIAILGFTLATELSSFVTFAGLITAGLAVAMQSVLVSIVGYFFLIGKYGIRVGDRVQIGNVTGEVIDLGLVRLHLMELGGQMPLGPTGRVVAFANSIVFQSAGGIFKQIPGVNLAWHEITLALPATADYTAMKEELAVAANRVLTDYREDILRQTREIQRTASSTHEDADVQAHVQLRFSAESVDAVVRYPVQLQRAAEIDERVSRELLTVIRGEEPPRAVAYSPET